MRFKIVSDNNKKSKKIEKIVKKKLNKIKITYENYKKSRIIFVIGGDGFMLRSLKRYNISETIFYGINTGNYGFLMNKFSSNSFIKKFTNAKLVKINPLEMLVKNKKKIKKLYAINEAYVLRQSKQAAFISVKINKKYLIRKLVSDGIIVSTPAGSTAYNLSVHGPILDLDSNKLSVVPISPFRPRRWRGKILNDNIKILIKNLSIIKRPIIAVADNQEIKNVEEVFIKSIRNISFKLLFNKDESLQKKIKVEQIIKETY